MAREICALVGCRRRIHHRDAGRGSLHRAAGRGQPGAGLGALPRRRFGALLRAASPDQRLRTEAVSGGHRGSDCGGQTDGGRGAHAQEPPRAS
eukprot:6746342-Heterocapsa_arctica.AAC.1